MATVKTYEVGTGFGYDILNEEGVVVHNQPFNPQDGFNPFKTEEDATAHANNVLNPQ